MTPMFPWPCWFHIVDFYLKAAHSTYHAKIAFPSNDSRKVVNF